MLPNGWAAGTVDDLGEYLNGMAFKPTDWGGEGIGIVRIQNLTDPSKPLNKTKRPFEERYRVKTGDLLVSWSATLDAFIWDREDAVLNQHIFKVTPSECVEPTFLFYQLRELIAEMAASEHLHGSTMKHINRGPFLAHAAALPPKAEQRRIVAKLDALTARLARARAELDRVPVLAGKLRETAYGTLWATSQRRGLSELLADPIRNGLSIAGSDLPPGVPALRLSALRGTHVNLADVRYLPITEDRAKPYRLRPGDLLVSRGNGTLSLVGKASLVAAPDADLPIFPDTAFRIRVDTTRASNRWLLHVWNSPQMRVQIEGAARTTAGIWKIAQRDLLAFTLPVEQMRAQEALADAIDATFARADRLEAEATRARALLDRLEAAILARAFRGELVPQDPNDEPASVLLDRIRAQRAAAPKPKRGREVSGT